MVGTRFPTPARVGQYRWEGECVWTHGADRPTALATVVRSSGAAPIGHVLIQTGRPRRRYAFLAFRGWAAHRVTGLRMNGSTEPPLTRLPGRGWGAKDREA